MCGWVGGWLAGCRLHAFFQYQESFAGERNLLACQDSSGLEEKGFSQQLTVCEGFGSCSSLGQTVGSEGFKPIDISGLQCRSIHLSFPKMGVQVGGLSGCMISVVSLSLLEVSQRIGHGSKSRVPSEHPNLH